MISSKAASFGPAALHELLKDYKASENAYDELIDRSGSIRLGYAPLLETFAALGQDGLNRRWEAGRRMVLNRVFHSIFRERVADSRGNGSSTRYQW